MERSNATRAPIRTIDGVVGGVESRVTISNASEPSSRVILGHVSRVPNLGFVHFEKTGRTRASRSRARTCPRTTSRACPRPRLLVQKQRTQENTLGARLEAPFRPRHTDGISIRATCFFSRGTWRDLWKAGSCVSSGWKRDRRRSRTRGDVLLNRHFFHSFRRWESRIGGPDPFRVWRRNSQIFGIPKLSRRWTVSSLSLSLSGGARSTRTSRARSPSKSEGFAEFFSAKIRFELSFENDRNLKK